MTNRSQNDRQWRDEKLGTSNKTIGSHGCTITDIGMMADLTPSQVNQRLLAGGGYAQGNLVWWTKLQACIPWLQFEWRGYRYENDRVAAAIAKNGSCLVAVDGRPIGGTSKDGHWVLYIGNRQMIDPWDGQTKPTSTYLATGYAIINKVGENPGEGDMSEELTVCLRERKKFWEERDALIRELGAADQNAAIEEIKRLKKRDEEYAKHKCPITPVPEPSNGFEIKTVEKFDKNGGFVSSEKIVVPIK